MSADKWTADDVPDQSGRVAVITGANTGIGHEAAAVPAGKAADELRAAHPRIDLLINNSGVIHTPNRGLMAQSAEMGALPTLRAATDRGVRNAEYYGPDGFAEQRGHPKRVKSSARSHDEDLQRRLWQVSEEMTGVTFPV